MPRLKFEPAAAVALRQLAAEDPQAPAYLAVKRLLYDLRDEHPDDLVPGTPFRIDGENTYYREVGRHPDVLALVWKRYPANDLIVVAYVGDNLL